MISNPVFFNKIFFISFGLVSSHFWNIFRFIKKYISKVVALINHHLFCAVRHSFTYSEEFKVKYRYCSRNAALKEMWIIFKQRDNANLQDIHRIVFFYLYILFAVKCLFIWRSARNDCRVSVHSFVVISTTVCR